MISDKMELRPRYGEVDQMGYVYHANYVSYCHQARTELLRKLGINDKALEDKNIMIPVIAFEIIYKKPAHYDEKIFIQTIIRDLPKVKLQFEFEIKNEGGLLLSTAKSTVAFVNKESRTPVVVPDFILTSLKTDFKTKEL